jgi:hypothetical protein
LFGKSITELMEICSDSGQPGEPDEPLGQSLSRSFDGCPPFAISSLPGSDSSEMDASLLMSESYSPPLYGSDLSQLIDGLFDPETMTWLKHLAAKKYLSWRRRVKDNRVVVFRDGRKHQKASGVSFTSKFRGYATTSAEKLIKEASLGSGQEQAKRLLEKLCIEMRRGTVGLLEGTLSAQETCRPELLPANIDFAASSKKSMKHAELELPRWSRPKEQQLIRSQSDRTDLWKSRHRRRGHGRKIEREKEIRASDPLGLISVWEDFGVALMWGAGGGVIVGVVVVLGKWWFSRSSD